MNVLVTTEQRFDRTPDGNFWTASNFAYAFWTRYLDVFDRVSIIARARTLDAVPSTYRKANGLQVDFLAIPYYKGPAQFLCSWRDTTRTSRTAVSRQDAVIFRIPSPIATLIEPTLRKQHQPFGVEVVGDPHDAFAPGAVRHPLRPIFRWWFSRAQKEQCLRAVGAAYVTKLALQKRYPCRLQQFGISDVELRDFRPNHSQLESFSMHHSSIELETSDYVRHPRIYRDGIKPLRLIFVGTLEQLYKNPDVLIRAFAENIQRGLELELVIVGDGRYRAELENLATKLGVIDKVIFTGMLPQGKNVKERLDLAHLFVLPSQTEGLPRAMIEAMARALPCIGSNVGGIPELLDASELIPPGNVIALADKIREIVTDPQKMTRLSERNLQIAHEYNQSILRARRVEFYQYIRHRTEEWHKEYQI